MHIHIVQKGDTLWKLAQEYQVDFEELKKANAHLADPDKIMPGMKIKIPTKSVPVKKEMPKSPGKEVPKKEMPKPHLPKQPKVPPMYQPSPIPQFQGVTKQQQMNMNVNVYKSYKGKDEKKHVADKKEVGKKHMKKTTPPATLPTPPTPAPMPEAPMYQMPPYPYPCMIHPCHFVPWTPVLPGYGFSPCGSFPPYPMRSPYGLIQEEYLYPPVDEYREEQRETDETEERNEAYDWENEDSAPRSAEYGEENEYPGKYSPWVNQFYNHNEE